jgi:hypothetical protein
VEAFAQSSSLGAFQSNIQIDFNPGTNPTTSATITNASNNTESYTLPGAASVETAVDSAATASGSGPNILVGGDNATLSATGTFNTEYLFVDLGNNGLITTGANATVDTEGNDTTVTNTGTGCTDGIHCDGDIVNSNAGTIDLGTSDSNITLNGSADVVNVSDYDSISVGAGGDNTIWEDGTSASVTDTGTNDTLSQTVRPTSTTPRRRPRPDGRPGGRVTRLATRLPPAYRAAATSAPRSTGRWMLTPTSAMIVATPVNAASPYNPPE